MSKETLSDKQVQSVLFDLINGVDYKSVPWRMKEGAIKTIANKWGISELDVEDIIQGKTYQHIGRTHQPPFSDYEYSKPSWMRTNPKPIMPKGNSKLTKPQVKNIIKLLSEGKTQKSIADKYKVSTKCVADIKKGNTWKDISRSEQPKPETKKKKEPLSITAANTTIKLLNEGTSVETIIGYWDKCYEVSPDIIEDILEFRTWKELKRFPGMKGYVPEEPTPTPTPVINNPVSPEIERKLRELEAYTKMVIGEVRELMLSSQPVSK